MFISAIVPYGTMSSLGEVGYLSFSPSSSTSNYTVMQRFYDALPISYCDGNAISSCFYVSVRNGLYVEYGVLNTFTGNVTQRDIPVNQLRYQEKQRKVREERRGNFIESRICSSGHSTPVRSPPLISLRVPLPLSPLFPTSVPSWNFIVPNYFDLYPSSSLLPPLTLFPSSLPSL
jgi:hypothetical protein